MAIFGWSWKNEDYIWFELEHLPTATVTINMASGWFSRSQLIT